MECDKHMHKEIHRNTGERRAKKKRQNINF